MASITYRIKTFLLKKPKLYIFVRSLREIIGTGYHDLYKLLIGYYEKETDEKAISLVLENSSDFLHKPAIYDISFGEFENSPMGFCALLFWTLWQIYFADRLGFMPMVTWGNDCRYYDEGMSDITDNVFEYYFCSTLNHQNMTKEAIRKNYPICRAYARYILNIGSKKDSYFETDQDGLSIHAEIYKKYIRLNTKTEEYLKTELSKLFGKGKTLGVHVRGTDFKKGYKDHPIAIAFDEYLTRAKEIYQAGSYSYVFLATDDCEALELFKKEFGNKLIYYPDTFRTAGNNGPHETDSMRPLHHYKLGLEVLRDVYTLACCNGFVCSLSNVGFAARYINLALERKYEDLVILDHGVAETDSQIAKEAKRQKRQNKRI